MGSAGDSSVTDTVVNPEGKRSRRTFPRRRLLRALEAGCWMVALCAGIYLAQVKYRVHAAAPPAEHAPVEGAVLGEMQIPALHLEVPVIEGDSKASLLRGVGHIPGTVLPGGLGTMGLAGHRDTFLRKIARIQPHTMIEVSHGDARYRYVVDSTQIVHPEDVQILETADIPELVVVTCYPFHYIGAAPLRFIVKAHLVSLFPETVR
jgi:sortase A